MFSAFSRIRLLFLLITFLPVPDIWGQTIGACDERSGLLELRVPGGHADDQGRLAQLRNGADTGGFLLRSAGSVPRQRPTRCGVRIAAVAPWMRTTWNSALPFSLNDGSLWAGRGPSAEIGAGFIAEYGPLYLLLAPQLEYSRNRAFDEFLSPRSPDHALLPIWQTGIYLIDVPLRPGYISSHRAEIGQSTLAVRTGPLAIGGTTADEWWGPGVRNAIVLSNNAPGIPRIFLSSNRPLATPLGDVEFRWLAGELLGSGYFGPDPGNNSPTDARAFSAVAATLRVAAEPGLTLGLARSVYVPISGGFGDALGHAADVVTHWQAVDTAAADPPQSDQIISLFGRWVLPAAGAELYGEWARHELPGSLKDLLMYPNHSRGYTIGLQWSGEMRSHMVLKVQTEATNLETDPTYRLGRQPSYYVGRSSPAGYTNRGRVIGAAIGPGSSSQWLATDLYAPGANVGLFISRIRWNDDAYFSHPSPWLFLGHDVSVYGGLRGGYERHGFRLDFTLSRGKRMNYLFQNWATSWETAGIDAVDVWNTRLDAQVSYVGRAHSDLSAPVYPARAPDGTRP